MYRHKERLTPLPVEIEPAEGGCELTLIHETSPEWEDQVGDGWKMIFDSLAKILP